MGANAVFVNKMLLKFQLDKIRRFVLFPGQLMTVHAVGIHVDGVPHQRPYQTLRQRLHNGNKRYSALYISSFYFLVLLGYWPVNSS